MNNDGGVLRGQQQDIGSSRIQVGGIAPRNAPETRDARAGLANAKQPPTTPTPQHGRRANKGGYRARDESTGVPD